MSVFRDMVEADEERYTPEASPSLSEHLLNQAKELQALIDAPIHEYLDIQHVF